MSVATTVRVRLSHVVSSVASLSIEDDPSASFGYSYLMGSVAAHSENKNKKTEYLNGASLGAFQPSLNFEETTLRSIVKAIMWRIIAGSVTFYTAFNFSKSLKTALSIVGSDFLSKAVTMFIGTKTAAKKMKKEKFIAEINNFGYAFDKGT